MIRPERDAGRGSGRRATPAPTSPDREAAGRLYDRIYVVVAAIPAGRVATYGQVAALAGIPGHARQVGYALHALPESSELPWQRVINARGEVSARSGLDWVAGYQRHLLEEEGVVFDDRGRIDLARFLWEP
ncbi:MAG: MGMT family protein [Thermoanaerobaculia bacterium]